MQQLRFKTEKNEYEFICESVGNSRGFKHTANMFLNGRYITKCSAQYYNRTWEPWTFYSVICGCVYNLIETRENELLNEFKTARHYERLTAKRKNEYIDYKKEYPDTELLEYNSLLKVIKQR